MSPVRHSALFLVAALAGTVWAAGAGAQSPTDDASGHVYMTADSVIFERVSNTRFLDGSFDEEGDVTDPLPPDEEIVLARALVLMRTSRLQEAVQTLDLLWRRHPSSTRVAQAAASAYLRAGRAQEALRLLDLTDRAVREARQRSDAVGVPSLTSRDPLANVRARALLMLGRRNDAIPWMIEGASDPSGDAGDLRRQLLEWAETVDVGPAVRTAAARAADRAPREVERALLAAEIECRAGRTQAAVARLERVESATGDARRGELVSMVAERLLGDTQGAALAAPLWLELARGSFAPDVRADALRRLIAPTILVDDGYGAGVAMGAREPFAVPAAELESAWRSLPAGEDRTRVGLELLNALRSRGENALADRVASELSRTQAPASLAGPMDLEAGLLALSQGHLDDAGKRLERARAQATDDDARERAEFAGAEVLFYSARSDSAQAAFDAFAIAHPRSRLANDALERSYLLEGDGEEAPEQSPGLASLAQGLYAEARRQWDESAHWAHRADDEARQGQGPVGAALGAAKDSELTSGGARNPVRAHALLLLSRIEEARNALDAARSAALVVADSLPGDRLAPLARRRVGDLELTRGRKEAALAQYEEMLARYPRSWLAAEVRREVTQLRADLAKVRTP